jgi:polysaccharide biosynthesis transport protein
MTTGRMFTSGTGTGSPSLLDYLHVLWRRKWVFLVTFLLVPGFALALSLRQTPVYEASADVLLRPPTALDVGGVPQGNVDPARFAQTQALLARVPDVAALALEKVPDAGLTLAEFRKASGVVQSPGSDLLTFTFKSSDPRLATALATAYARAFTQYKGVQDLAPYKKHLEEVRSEIADLTLAGDTHSAAYKKAIRDEQDLSAHVDYPIESAEVVRTAGNVVKVAPRPARNGGIGIVLGLVLGLGAAFLLEALDTRIRSVDVVRETLGIPVLGQIPAPPKELAKRGGLVMLADPMSQQAECFRTLRANFAFANGHYNAQVILVTSAVGGEGKSTTAGNLAIALARGGRSVVLVDGDLRSPRVHELFGLAERPGLTDIELGEASLDEALREINFAEASERGGRSGTLEVLPAGHALHDPDELGAEEAVARVVRALRTRADVILIDAAPLLLVGDAVALSAHVDGLMIVMRLQHLRSSTLAELDRILAATPAPWLGVVVTGAPPSATLAYRRYEPPPGGRTAESVVERTASWREADARKRATARTSGRRSSARAERGRSAGSGHADGVAGPVDDVRSDGQT